MAGLYGTRGNESVDPAVILNRIRTYRRESEPCIAHYQGNGTQVHVIDGLGTIEEVTSRIFAALDSVIRQDPS